MRVDSRGRSPSPISRGLGHEASADSTTLVDVSAPTVSDSSNLDVAVDAMASSSQHWVPVLDAERKVIGTIATSDVVRGYRLGLLASLQKVNAEGDRQWHGQGADRIGVPRWSAKPYGSRGLPISIIVTTILRKQDLVVPNGSTVLEVGDELVVIGQSSDIDLILKTTTDRWAHGDGHGCIREGQGEGSPGSVIPGTKEG